MASERAAQHRGGSVSGLAAGLIGGLAASWIMNQVQALLDPRAGAQRQLAGNTRHRWRGKNDPESLPIAAAVSQKVFHHTLTDRQKEPAATAVHYLFGTLLGGVYGILADRLPAASASLGVPFGAAVWFSAEKVALPLLHLDPGLSARTRLGQGKDLLVHIVYGMATDLVRRAARRALT